MKITVIGEANIDIMVVPQTAQKAGGCVPGHVSFHHGGVARNIAHNLCLLNHEVRLMTVFGGDDLATRLIDDCKYTGMNVALSTQFKDSKSPIFLSFNDATGNMQSAISDIELNNRMDLHWLKGKMDDINHSEMIVADTLLSAEALAHLIDHCEKPLYIDTVSPGKAMRLAEAMKMSEKQRIFTLKCNLPEALALTNEKDAEAAVKQLNANGIKHVYLTLGSDGIIHCSNGEARHYPALPTQITNVTGSGDAFFAGIIHANALGHFGDAAVSFGLKAAQHNIKSEAPVNPTLRLDVFNE